MAEQVDGGAGAEVNRTAVVVWSAIMLAIATISTGVRLWSRRKVGKGIKMEDWLVVLAVVSLLFPSGSVEMEKDKDGAEQDRTGQNNTEC